MASYFCRLVVIIRNSACADLIRAGRKKKSQLITLENSHCNRLKYFYLVLPIHKTVSNSNHPLQYQKSSNFLQKSVDDNVLWQSVRKGNELAFSSLYKKYVNKFFNYGMHLCYDREIVSDTIQELFTNLWARHEQLTEVNAVNYYLFKSFRNLLVQRINQQKKSFEHIDEFYDFQLQDLTCEESLIVEQSNEEQRKKLRVAMSTLTKRQREVIVLKFYNELSYPEVASVMDISVESAHNLLSKAIHILRDQFVPSIQKSAGIISLPLFLFLDSNSVCSRSSLAACILGFRVRYRVTMATW